MKILLGLFLTVFMQLCSSSKKTEQEIFDKRDTFVGKWQLFETCISPGNACEPKKIENGAIIEFKTDGNYLVTNSPATDGSYLCNGQWKLIEIQTNPVQKALQLNPSCNKALWTLYYSFNADNTLNINPQCFEECRYTYKPI